MTPRKQAAREASEEDASLSERERLQIRRLFRWVELPRDFKGDVTDFVAANGSPHVSKIPTLKGEEWREVGATGQPAFANSWSNFGSGFDTAGFYKDALGIVHLKGLVDGPAGAGTGSGTVAFTLPEGYRPAATVRTIGVGEASGGTGVGVIDIATSGTVTLTAIGVAANAAVTDFSLNTSFRAA